MEQVPVQEEEIKCFSESACCCGETGIDLLFEQLLE